MPSSHHNLVGHHLHVSSELRVLPSLSIQNSRDRRAGLCGVHCEPDDGITHQVCAIEVDVPRCLVPGHWCDGQHPGICDGVPGDQDGDPTVCRRDRVVASRQDVGPLKAHVANSENGCNSDPSHDQGQGNNPDDPRPPKPRRRPHAHPTLRIRMPVYRNPKLTVQDIRPPSSEHEGYCPTTRVGSLTPYPMLRALLSIYRS